MFKVGDEVYVKDVDGFAREGEIVDINLETGEILVTYEDKYYSRTKTMSLEALASTQNKCKALFGYEEYWWPHLDNNLYPKMGKLKNKGIRMV